jgi:hypothetical protein
MKNILFLTQDTARWQSGIGYPITHSHHTNPAIFLSVILLVLAGVYLLKRFNYTYKYT